MIKCYDKFNQLLEEGDYVDVQKDGVRQIYEKEDGELYFNPYGDEDKVSSYFSNDLVKCDEVGNWITNDRSEFEKEYEQEVEETIEEGFNRISDSIDFKEFDFASFKLGAKWQQEQYKNK